MKAITLVIDMQRASCDPDMGGLRCSFSRAAIMELTQRIHEFTQAARPFAPPVWAIQNIETNASGTRELTEEEKSFFVVEPCANDPKLPKTRFSAYPEHASYFEGLKAKGIDTVILCGVWANWCILETAEHLLEAGFTVILPEDLNLSSNFSPAISAWLDLSGEKNTRIVQSSQTLLTSLRNGQNVQASNCRSHSEIFGLLGVGMG